MDFRTCKLQISAAKHETIRCELITELQQLIQLLSSNRKVSGLHLIRAAKGFFEYQILDHSFCRSRRPLCLSRKFC